MYNKPIKVTVPFLPNKKKLYREFNNLYRSKQITNNGIFVRRLENKLKKYLGVKHIILTTNGTSAIQIALRALGIKKNIVTTPFSFVATTNAIIWEKLNPIFLESLKSLRLIPFLRITAAETTGPARQPLPTSSTPATINFFN